MTSSPWVCAPFAECLEQGLAECGAAVRDPRWRLDAGGSLLAG